MDGSRCWRVFRKWSTRLTVSMFFLAGGVEYSVILPTALDYLHNPQLTGGHPTGDWLYGLLLSAMSISHIFAGPFFGALFDRTHQTRVLVMIALSFEVAANFMYFVAYTAKSLVLLVGSRFVVGIGIGAGAVLFGDIARTSSKKERTAVFTLYMSTRQFGLILGPAFNLFLRECDFMIGPFTVNKFTAPGLFMVIIWAVIEVMYLLLFTHLPTVKDEEEEDNDNDVIAQATPQIQNHTSNASAKLASDSLEYSGNSLTGDADLNGKSSAVLDSDYSTAQQSSLVDEKSPLLAHSSSRQIQYGDVGKEVLITSNVPESVEMRSVCEKISRLIGKFLWLVNELMREEMVLLLALLFFTFFNQMAMETGLVPLVEAVLKWTEFETSIFFSGAGGVLLLSFIVMWLASLRIADRWLIAFGLALQLFSYTWFLVCLGQRNVPESARFRVLLELIFGSVVLIFGIPFFFVAGTSLYSKLLPRKIQGFGQGVRRSVGSLSAILGPLWAGSAFDIMDTLYLFYSVPLAFLVLIIVLTILSFSKLKVSSKKQPPTNKSAKINQA